MINQIRYSLNGDLNQMVVQKRYLQTECVGFVIIQESSFFPLIESESEYERALNCFWNDRVDGWWNYKDHLIKYLVCTEEEFKDVLREQVEAKKVRYEMEKNLRG
jgi:hypothetical protein